MRKKGFTLIELLVVIAIIGLLATMAVVNFGNARAKARDARRLADINQISKALELYYDMYGAYPIGNAGSDRACWINNEGYSGCHPLGALKDAGLMGRVPYDPGKNTYIGAGTACDMSQFYGYRSDDGYSYVLGCVQEISSDSCACILAGSWGNYEHCVRNAQ